MLDSQRWTKAETHMVRYHSSHLVWVTSGSIVALVAVASAAVLVALLGTGAADASADAWWMASVVGVPALTAAIWGGKVYLLRRVSADWTLYKAILLYKWTLIIAMFGFLLAASFVCWVVAFVQAGVVHYAAVVLVPVAAMVLNFPHRDRLIGFVDETYARAAVAGELGPQ